MIGLDANIILRFITQDDPVLAARATRLIERELTAAEPGYVNLIALAETAWSLRRTYGYDRREVADEIERLLSIDSLVIAHEAEVYDAVSLVRDGRGEFADALIGRLNAAAGCARTLTFDRGALRLPGFAAL